MLTLLVKMDRIEKGHSDSPEIEDVGLDLALRGSPLTWCQSILSNYTRRASVAAVLHGNHRLIVWRSGVWLAEIESDSQMEAP